MEMVNKEKILKKTKTKQKTFSKKHFSIIGLQTNGEPGISGVTVVARLADNTVLGTTTSDGAGMYTLDSFEAGLTANTDITIVVRPSGDYTPTQSNVGANRAIDSSGVNVAGSLEYTLTLPDWGVTLDDVDFGFRAAMVLGDLVFVDSNGNGVLDAGETGLSGVSLQLRERSPRVNVGAPIVTDADGLFSFSSATLPLKTDTQYEIVLTMPVDMRPSPAQQGSDSTKDSDLIEVANEYLIRLTS